MTEQEWLECAEPTPMLDFVRGKVSDRQLRLFASGVCGGLDVAERYADGNATDEELDQTWMSVGCRVWREFAGKRRRMSHVIEG